VNPLGPARSSTPGPFWSQLLLTVYRPRRQGRGTRGGSLRVFGDALQLDTETPARRTQIVLGLQRQP
jgi:hypothetical protein